ncbi:MAG: MBL fold metallo-hydrolase [Clostridia bacterium]|nr:MBL fold metallo-hydrolase [Clostridia bacterium]
MEIRWFGTASVEIRSESGHILFDPFVPLAGSDVNVKLEDFDGCTAIFVTHGHFDHIVNIPEIQKRNPGARIYCTKTPYHTLAKKGVPKDALRLIGFGQTVEAEGFTVRTFHGRHAVLPKAAFDRLLYIKDSPHKGNLPFILRENAVCPENDETVFYLAEQGGKRISLMGSLNIREDVDYPTDCDAIVLPYNGWQDNLPPAVKAVERLRPKMIYLDHYDDTFPPLTRPFDISPVLEKYAGRIAALKVGARIIV